MLNRASGNEQSYFSTEWSLWGGIKVTVVRRVYYDTCFLTRENIFVIFKKKKKDTCCVRYKYKTAA